MKSIKVNNTVILLGQNALENWNIFDKSEPNHWFMHLSSFPSGYIVILSENPTEYEFEQAAVFCLSSTKYRNLKNVKVDYCKISNLKKTDIPGEVCFIKKKQVKQLKIKNLIKTNNEIK